MLLQLVASNYELMGTALSTGNTTMSGALATSYHYSSVHHRDTRSGAQILDPQSFY